MRLKRTGISPEEWTVAGGEYSFHRWREDATYDNISLIRDTVTICSASFKICRHDKIGSRIVIVHQMSAYDLEKNYQANKNRRQARDFEFPHLDNAKQQVISAARLILSRANYSDEELFKKGLDVFYDETRPDYKIECVSHSFW